MAKSNKPTSYTTQNPSCHQWVIFNLMLSGVLVLLIAGSFYYFSQKIDLLKKNTIASTQQYSHAYRQHDTQLTDITHTQKKIATTLTHLQDELQYLRLHTHPSNQQITWQKIWGLLQLANHQLLYLDDKTLALTNMQRAAKILDTLHHPSAATIHHDLLAQIQALSGATSIAQTLLQLQSVQNNIALLSTTAPISNQPAPIETSHSTYALPAWLNWQSIKTALFSSIHIERITMHPDTPHNLGSLNQQQFALSTLLYQAQWAAMHHAQKLFSQSIQAALRIAQSMTVPEPERAAIIQSLTQLAQTPIADPAFSLQHILDAVHTSMLAASTPASSSGAV